MLNKISILSILIFIFSSCLKNNPKKESFLLAGSWKVEEVNIKEYNESGEILSDQQVETSGYLMLSHVDPFLYEGVYSYSLDVESLKNSMIFEVLLKSNIWGVSNGAKVLNFSIKDSKTGYVQLMASLTINKLNRRKLEIQFIKLSTSSGNISKKEVWYLKSDN